MYKHLVSNNRSTTYEQMRQYIGRVFLVEPKNALSFPFLVNNNIHFSDMKKKYIYLIWHQHGAIIAIFFPGKTPPSPGMKSRKEEKQYPKILQNWHAEVII